MFSDDHAVAGKAHRIRAHDFIGHGILEYAVLMDARFMGKGVRTHNGFVGLYHNAGDHGDQTTGGMNLLGFDTEIQSHLIPAGKKGHHNFFQGRIPGPLTDTVDGHLHLTSAGPYARQGIGRGQPQIIVAMDTHDSLVDIGCVRPHISHQFTKFFRHGIPHRIGQVDGGGAGRNGRLKYAA